MEYDRTTKVRWKTLFFAYQSVSRANTVNMNVPPLEQMNELAEISGFGLMLIDVDTEKIIFTVI
jgi:hypothetical protein